MGLRCEITLSLLLVASTLACSRQASFEFSTTGRTRGGGSVSGTPSIPPVNYKAFTQCEPAEIAVAPTAPRRLSRNQYEATVTEALRGSAGSLIQWHNREGVLFERFAVGPLATTLAQVPRDYGDRTYSKTDTRFTEAHLEGYYAVANHAAEYFLSNPSALGLLVSDTNCVQNPNEVCVKTFFSKLAQAFLSRPLDAQELSRHWNSFQSWSALTPSERFSTALRAMMLHPEFLQLFQNRGEPVPEKNNLIKKTPFEIVRSLALQFSDSPPSAALYSMAENATASQPLNPAAVMNALVQPAAYANVPNDCTSSQCNPVFPLSPAQQVMAQFFTEHVEFDRFPGFGSDPLTQASYLNSGEDPLAGNRNYYSDMRNELQALAFRNFWKGSSFSQYMTDPTYSIGSSNLSRMYGFNSSTVYDPQGIPIAGRSGPLTRAGFLNSGTPYPNMILLGTKVLRKFACQTVPDPDPRNLPEGFRSGAPRHDPPISSRQYLTQQTQGSSCTACHSVINPVGFAFGKFNGIGAFHNGGSEIIWQIGTNGTPAVAGTVPVDSSSSIFLDDQRIAIQDAVSLSQVISQSDEAKICYARQLFEFAFGRKPAAQDACSVRPVYERVKSGTMKDAWLALGRSQEVTYRAIAP